METEKASRIPNKPVCPLTGSRDVIHLYDAVDHACSREVFGIWKDRSSGILFTHPAPDKSEIGRYYEMENYLSHDSEQPGFTASVYGTIRRIMLGKKWRMLRPFPDTGSEAVKLLDIGCGTGEFMKYGIKTRPALIAHGVEPSEAASQKARKLSDKIRVFPDIHSIPEKTSYHLITAWHALEHIHELKELMHTAADRLHNNGLFCVALPNHTSWDARHYGPDWAAYDVPRHLWHFSPEAFTDFAATFGFRLQKTFRLPFDPFYVCLLSERAGNSGLIRLVKAGVKASVSTAVSLMQRNRSSSLVYILRKQS